MMDEVFMVRTQIQLTDEQHSALKRLAESKRVSMAELVRQGVDEVLKSGITVSDGELRKRALEIVGRFNSGKSDISEKHDEYFAEAIET
jgi:Arc/MetJ-type ribon-helix-helix transcriptional regulator